MAVDSSVEVARKLFAVFPQMPLELEEGRLRELLNTPPACTVPVSATELGGNLELWPMDWEGGALFKLAQQGEHCRKLQFMLEKALRATWPSGTPSQLLYTPYWNDVGWALPKAVADLLEVNGLEMQR